MKLIKNTLLLIFLLVVLTCCSSVYYVDLSKISFENIKLKKVENTDSLQLSFHLKIPPKSVGKKSIAVVLPMIINEPDTLKFKTLTLAGEGNWDDCMNIPYKYETTRGYFCIEKAFRQNLSISDIYFQVFMSKNKVKREIIYQKKVVKFSFSKS